MEILLVGLGIVAILLGVIGVFAPGLPDAPLAFLGFVMIGFGVGFDELSWVTWLLLGLLALLMWVAELAATGLGTAFAKSSKTASVLAIIGAALGFFTAGLPGLLIGPFVGAVLGELLVGRDLAQSAKSGLAAVVGMLSGMVMKSILVFVMVLAFVIGLLF